MGDLGGMRGAEATGGALGWVWGRRGGQSWPGEASQHLISSRLLPPQYFISRLADTENMSHLGNQTDGAALSHSYLQSMFDNFMTLCAMVPLLVFTCLNSFIHQR